MSEIIKDETEGKVYNALKESGKPMRSGEVAETAGIDMKIVSKTITKLKKKGLVSSPKRCYYSVSEK
ncbi:ArsR family transcriptional regulator [Methanohalophilus sp. RSK]|uniref:helix-turn-helix domain-containing protein n=1 Tax=Methanohalophilus sp. RSK TaxID=2485783 RepID=UPI000F43ADFD|nr:helix-turn-helix domain-containing protein [Methanohalophilus sp. RSK]RNI12887.1 ArsR family transcriptional regulator [Methanohalophilus sp. RSK]